MRTEQPSGNGQQKMENFYWMGYWFGTTDRRLLADWMQLAAKDGGQKPINDTCGMFYGNKF